MYPVISYLLLSLDLHRDRARREEGASAVEWVIIAAIVVGLCIAVAAILKGALEGEATEISNEIRNQ